MYNDKLVTQWKCYLMFLKIYPKDAWHLHADIYNSF